MDIIIKKKGFQVIVSRKSFIVCHIEFKSIWLVGNQEMLEGFPDFLKS